MSTVFIVEVIKFIVGVVLVCATWLLSIRTININHRKDEKKKLNRLLYYLLELRYRAIRERSLERDYVKIWGLLIKLLKEQLPIPDLEMQYEMIKPVLYNFIRSYFKIDAEKNNIEDDIDKILLELAEVEPIFAYELVGQHNIKERLKVFNELIDTTMAAYKDDSVEVGEILQPALLDDIIKDLEESLRRVAKRIDRKALQDVKNKLNKPVEIDFDEADAAVFMMKFFEPAISHIVKQQNDQRS